jgi:hypothetical protein
VQRLIVSSQLSISCGQIDNRVSFQIAEAQTKLAHSNKREAVSQKVIAILGTVFLPGAYLSVRYFSTPPINFQHRTNTSPVPLQHDILQFAADRHEPRRLLCLATVLDLLGNHDSPHNCGRRFVHYLGPEALK